MNAGPRRRSRQARARLRRTIAVAVAALAALALAATAIVVAARRPVSAHHQPNGATATVPPAHAPATSSPQVAMSVTATLAGWKLPVPLSRSVVEMGDGGKLLVLGGLTSNDRTVATITEIDPATGSSRPVAQLAKAAHDAAGALIGGDAFVFGGGGATELATVQRWAPGTPAAAAAGALPTTRSDLVTVQSGGQVYLVGGYDGRRPVANVLRTTDGTTFTTVSVLPEAVRYPAVAMLGTTLYVIGGQSASGETNAIQAVDITTGSARVVVRMPAPISHAAAVTIDGAVYVLGGRRAGAALDEMARFDATTGALTAVGRLPLALSDAGVATAGDTAYLIGGEAATQLTSVVEVRGGPPNP